MTTIRWEDSPDGTSPESTWSNPSKLSRKIRELAYRSYRALKAGRQREVAVQVGRDDRAEDLRDLRAQVERLQRKIHERQYHSLIPWVDALRRRVEDRLATRESSQNDRGSDS
jgi:hypothetical protein